MQPKICLITGSTLGGAEYVAEHVESVLQQQFAVIGLGNSDYDTFCFAVDRVEQTLLAKSAVKIIDALRIDVLTETDQEQCAEDWLPNFTNKISSISFS